mmetsp:Transcript_14638/g.42848  ORF Transcript_14638/g.42848 Transcript_14638/m.42848 type:complete len:282 (+) Transcript_14638:1307-2152(+)
MAALLLFAAATAEAAHAAASRRAHYRGPVVRVSLSAGRPGWLSSGTPECVGMGNQQRRVAIRDLVLLQTKSVQIQSLQLRLHTFPAHENPRRVCLTLEQRVPDAQHRRRRLSVCPLPAVVHDHLLHNPALVASAVARVRLAIQLGRAVEAAARERHHRAGGVCQHGGHALDLRLAASRMGVEADDRLGRTDREGGGAVLDTRRRRGLVLVHVRRQQLHVQAGVGVQPLGLGDVEAGVVGVGAPVEGHRDRRRGHGDQVGCTGCLLEVACGEGQRWAGGFRI